MELWINHTQNDRFNPFTILANIESEKPHSNQTFCLFIIVVELFHVYRYEIMWTDSEWCFCVEFWSFCLIFSWIDSRIGISERKNAKERWCRATTGVFFPFCTIHVNLIQLGEIWQQRACMHTHPCIFMYVRVRREYKVYVWAHRSSICYIHPFFGISGDAIQLQPTRLHDSTHTNLNALKPSIATVLSILPFFQ